MDKETKADALKKFEAYLAGLTEIDLIILRGHLLLEEILYSIVSEFVFHPTFIKKSDISFSQIVNIARSMSLDDENNSMWGLILAINTLRNKIAHELSTSPNIQKHITKVKDLYNSEMKGSQGEFERLWLDDDCGGMKFSIAMSMGFLYEFQDEVKRFKKAVGLIDAIYNPHKHDN